MKLEDLESEMQFKVLAIKNFCIGAFNNKKALLGDIDGIKPSFEFNNDLSFVKSNMYTYEDFLLAELGTCSDFRSYLKGLEKINNVLTDCPFIEMYKATNTFLGYSILECKIWWETNIDLIFQPHLIKDFFDSEIEQLKFQAMHLKMLELFRFCSAYGFMQIATKKDFDDFKN